MKGNYKVFANIPYFKLTEASNPATDIFHPMPSVDSVMVHFARKALPERIWRKEQSAHQKASFHCIKTSSKK